MKKLSRQRQWQLKKIEEGLCYICGNRKIFKSKLCKTHHTKKSIDNKIWHENNKEKHLALMKARRERQ